MANEPEISENGIFKDLKTGEIVYSQPEEGVQLCAPGGLITKDVELNIQLAKDEAAGVSHVGTLGTSGTVDVAETPDEKPAKAKK